MRIKIKEAASLDLFCLMPGTSSPQDCYISVDLRSGEMWAEYNPEIGDFVPSAVYMSTIWLPSGRDRHGSVLRFYLDSPIWGEAANRLMAALSADADVLITPDTDQAWYDARERIGKTIEEYEKMSSEGDYIAWHDASDWLEEVRHEIVAQMVDYAKGTTAPALISSDTGVYQALRNECVATLELYTAETGHPDNPFLLDTELVVDRCVQETIELMERLESAGIH